MISKLIIPIYLFLTVSGLIFMKKGMAFFSASFGSGKLMLNMPIELIVGITFYVLSFLSWMLILSKHQLSFIYPILVGLSYVGVLVAAHYVLKEPLVTRQVIGSVVVLIGIILINIK